MHLSHERCQTLERTLMNMKWDKCQCYLNRPRTKELRNFLTVLRKKHDEVLLAKGSPIGKGWRTNALPFDSALRKKKKFRKLTEAKYRPEHKLLATLTDQVRLDNQISWSISPRKTHVSAGVVGELQRPLPWRDPPPRHRL